MTGPATPATLAAELRAQGGQWIVAGIDRADELAALLWLAGVRQWGRLELVTRTDTVTYPGHWGGAGDQQEWIGPVTEKVQRARLRIGSKVVGFVGNADNDGTLGARRSADLQPGNLLAWSARGDGNVAYRVVSLLGVVKVLPEWGSSSDRDRIQRALTVAAVFVGAGLTFGALTGAGTVAAGAGSAGGATGAASGATGAATNAALIESAVQTVGYGASSAGLGGGAGVLAGAGATNAALIESAVQTAGYGASSAGLGGGAGTLAGTGSAVLDAIERAAGRLVENAAGNAIEAAAGALLPAAPGAGAAPGQAAGPGVPTVTSPAPGAVAGFPPGLLIAAGLVLLAVLL